MASPAEIVQQVLADLNLVRLPPRIGLTIPFTQLPQDNTTLCYVGSMPDDDDQAICVYDPAGIVYGRDQRSGETWGHDGIHLEIRALDYPTGYALANTIAVGIDSTSQIVTTTSDGVTHYIQSLYRTSRVISLGEEVGKKRNLFTIHARICFQATEPSLG